MKYMFATTTYFEGQLYQAGQEYELTPAQAKALGFEVKTDKQETDYKDKQIASAPRNKTVKKAPTTK